MDKLAKALRAKMDERGHSATRAAAIMGVSPPTVLNWAKGWISKAPDPEYWPVIARYLEVPPFVILGWFHQLTDAEVELLSTIPGSLIYTDALALAMVTRPGYLKPAVGAVLVAS